MNYLTILKNRSQNKTQEPKKMTKKEWLTKIFGGVEYDEQCQKYFITKNTPNLKLDELIVVSDNNFQFRQVKTTNANGEQTEREVIVLFGKLFNDNKAKFINLNRGTLYSRNKDAEEELVQIEFIFSPSENDKVHFENNSNFKTLKQYISDKDKILL